MYAAVRSWATAHPRYATAGAFLVVVMLIAVRWHPGYDWGPYRVRPSDTLSEILVRAVGDKWVAYAAISGLREQDFPVDVVWANVARGENGDVVRLRENELVITKPNGATIRAPLFSEAAYVKRRAQVVAYNIIVLLFGTLACAGLLVHAAGHALVPRVERRWVRRSTTTLYWSAAITAALVVGLVAFGMLASTFDYVSDPGHLFGVGLLVALSFGAMYLVVLLARWINHLTKTRFDRGWLWVPIAAWLGVIGGWALEVGRWDFRLRWFGW